MIDNTDFDIIMKLASKACLDEDVSEYDQLDTQNIEIDQKTTRRVKRALFFKTVQESQGVIVLKKITVACLLVCTIVFGVAMSIQPVRAAFFDVIVTWYDKYVGILLVNDSEIEYPNIIEEIIIPPLDEGWNIEIVSETQTLGMYVMTRPQGDRIIYQQKVYDSNEMKIDNTDYVLEEIILNRNVKAYICSYEDGMNILLWEDRYIFSLISYNVSCDYLIELAERLYN